MADWRATERLTPLEKLVIEYSEALTSTPAQPSVELRDRLRSELREKQIVELTNFIVWENARARFNRAFGIESDGYS